MVAIILKPKIFFWFKYVSLRSKQAETFSKDP